MLLLTWMQKGAVPGVDVVLVASAAAAGVPINHSLGVKPDMIIQKQTGGTGDW